MANYVAAVEHASRRVSRRHLAVILLSSVLVLVGTMFGAFAPGTTDRTRATRIRIDGPAVLDNVDIPVAESQEIATVSITAKDPQGRLLKEAAMSVSLDGYGTRGVGSTDASGIARVRIVKGVRMFLLGGQLGAGCMAPLQLGPDSYPAAVDVTFTPDGCRESDNLGRRSSLALSARDGLTTRRVRVLYPDGSPAYDVRVGILSATQQRPFTSVFRTARDGSLDLPLPLKSQFSVESSRYEQGIACQSEVVWFNTEREPIRWQRRPRRADAPNWEEEAESTGEIVLRLEGLACTPPH